MAQTFANHLLQSTVFAGLAGLLTLLLRSNHARTRYWLWLTASMKFVLPFSLLVDLGRRISWSTPPVIVEPQLYFAMSEVTQPFVTTSVGTPAAVPSIIPTLLIAVWAAGCAALLIVWLTRWLQAAAILRKAAPLNTGREFESLQRLNGQATLVSSPSRIEPGVFGIFLPVLSLPQGIADRLDDAQLDAILAHELCHIRRRDNLTAALHMLIETIFWFHPLTWWIGARLVEERERACDEEVVRLGGDPEIYAESILTICRYYLASPLPCAAGISGSDLKKRIESIMSGSLVANLTGGRKLLLGGSAAFALLLPVVAGFITIPAMDAQWPVPMTMAQVTLPPPPVPRRPPATPTQGQPATQPRLEFEAASVRSSPPSGGRGSTTGGPGTSDPERLTWENVYLRTLMMQAWAIKIDQIAGPSWFDSEKYAVVVKAPPGTTPEQFHIMMQNLLVDRFQMTLHHETREFDGYQMVQAKGGSKMKDSTFAPNYSLRRERGQGDAARLPVDGDGFPNLGVFKGVTSRFQDGRIFMTCRSCSMDLFTTLLSMQMGIPIPTAANRFTPARIVDSTGLSGEYDFKLSYAAASSPRGLATAPPGANPAGIPLDDGDDYFSAVEKQLGLRLEKARLAVDLLVIDHAEKVPTEN